jgi:hypothetical protein
VIILFERKDTGMKTIVRSFSEDDQLFFIHVPKCAGTSFISLLDEMFVNSEICPTHYDLRKFTRGEIGNEELQGYKFIRGHFPYDLIIPRLEKPPRLIIFLRDPIAQFISYHEMRKRVPDPISGMQEKIKDLSLEEFLDQSPYAEVIANNATKLLAGVPDGDRLFDFSTTIDVPLAKMRLEECEFIGITEEYEKSIGLFCHLYNFPLPEQHRELNVSPDRDKRRDINPKTLDRIAEIQYADLALYRYGKNLFQQALERMNSEKSSEVTASHFGFAVIPTEKMEFDFRRVLPGMGWQVGEEHPIHGIIRWSGPASTSKLYLPISKAKEALVQFCVTNWISTEILDSLELYVNGDRIPLHKERDAKSEGYIFKGKIPKWILLQQSGDCELAFRVMGTLRPKDLDSGNADERQIGLCYSWLSAEPVDGVTQSEY